GSGQKLEEVGRQVVELSAAGLAAEVVLDSPPDAVVGGLAHERRDLPLWLGADFHVGQPRGDVLGAHDRPGRQIDLVGDLEAVDVVVHRVEERETSVPALEARDLLALEDAPLARPRAVEVGLTRRRDGAQAEEAPPRVGVREAGVRQIDPPGHVELPALPRVAAGRALGALAGQLGRLAREPSDFDHRPQHEGGARARPGQLGHPAAQPADHRGARELLDARSERRIERAGDLAGSTVILHTGSTAIAWPPFASTSAARADSAPTSLCHVLSLRLFVTTDTDENAIAAPARIGERRTPQIG